LRGVWQGQPLFSRHLILDLGEKTPPALVLNRKRGSGSAGKVADDYDGLGGLVLSMGYTRQSGYTLHGRDERELMLQ
jgi:hypothetical protein